jgi:hypothetical protein
MSVNRPEVGDLQWRKARASAGNGACVEVAPVSGQIVIRDSKDPEGPVLSYSPEAFQSFLATAKEGAYPR